MYHIIPDDEIDEHTTDDIECFCGPTVEYIDPETGIGYPSGPIVIHNEHTRLLALSEMRRRARLLDDDEDDEDMEDSEYIPNPNLN